MNPVNFDGAQIIGKPKDWDPAKDGECIGLPAYVSTHKGGHPQFLSIWKPTDEERRRIAAGENIALSCVGLQPPVLMTVEAIDGPIVPFSTDKAPNKAA